MSYEIKIARAASVTKVLKAAGFEKAEWLRAGVSTRNDGFISSQSGSEVVVSWEFEGRYHDYSPAEKEFVNGWLAPMALALQAAGFIVRTQFQGNSNILIVVAEQPIVETITISKADATKMLLSWIDRRDNLSDGLSYGFDQAAAGLANLLGLEAELAAAEKRS